MQLLRVPYFLQCGAVSLALCLLVTASISTKLHAKHVFSNGNERDALHVAWLRKARFLLYTSMLWTGMILIQGLLERGLEVAILLLLNRMAVLIPVKALVGLDLNVAVTGHSLPFSD
jgi:hypothetical protein